MSNINYFLILGLPPTATASEIDASFATIVEKLKPSNFSYSINASEQASVALAKVRAAHTALLDERFREQHAEALKEIGEPFSPDQLKPFLGHVCVAAGIITYQDLMDSIHQQADIDLPLGQILQDRGLLSETELEGMLMGQKLYGAPNRPLDSMVKRLLWLGLISVDMIKIALIDQRTSIDSLDELMSKRGWIDKGVLAALK
jgi:curved DNA-binding protein CbpA